MKLINKLKRIYYKIKNNDPLFNCEYHQQHFCVHVDGPLCDFQNCNIRFNHIGEDFVYCQNCVYFDECCSTKFGLGCFNGKKL